MESQKHVWPCQLFKAAAVDCLSCCWLGASVFIQAKALFPCNTYINTAGLSSSAASNCCPGFRIAICQSHSLYVLESYAVPFFFFLLFFSISACFHVNIRPSLVVSCHWLSCCHCIVYTACACWHAHTPFCSSYGNNCGFIFTLIRWNNDLCLMRRDCMVRKWRKSFYSYFMYRPKWFPQHSSSNPVGFNYSQHNARGWNCLRLT